MKNNSIKLVKTAVLAVFWVGIWYLLSEIVGKEILVPSPYTTCLTLISMMKTSKFYISVGMTLLRIFAGFFISVALGTVCAVLSYRFPFFKTVFAPLLSLVRSIPVASFIILALVWIKTPYLPVFISFFTVLPIIWDTVLSGIENTEKAAIEAAEVDGATKWQIIFSIIVPAMIPSFFSSLITGLGFAWKSGIAAEVIAHPKHSIGGLLIDAKNYLETAEVFALTATVIILSLIIEKMLRAIYKKHMSKYER